MGACNSLLASCMYTCNCCICQCCFPILLCCTCCCGSHHTDDLEKSAFNNELGLVFYDKLSKGKKLNPTYQHQQEIWKEIKYSLIDNDQKMDNDPIIIDVGCGTGNNTEIICNTFLSNNNGSLINIDPSPGCLKFIREKVVDKNINLQNKNIKYIQNKKDSLCLTSKYNESMIDICLMSFVMHHISKNEGYRDLILKEIYKCLKPNGIFVVFEFGKEFMPHGHGHGHSHKQGDKHAHGHKHGHKKDDDLVALKKEQNDEEVFQDFNECKEYIETFGFKFQTQIMKQVIDKYHQWIIVFRK